MNLNTLPRHSTCYSMCVRYIYTYVYMHAFLHLGACKIRDPYYATHYKYKEKSIHLLREMSEWLSLFGPFYKT